MESENLLLGGIRAKSGKVDWQQIFKWHALKAFLPIYRENIAPHLSGMPKEIREKIEAYYLFYSAKNKQIKNLIIELSGAFQKAGIELIFLKGGGSLFTLYKNDIGARPMADFDVLVRKNSLEGAGKVLSALGYKEDYDKFNKLYHTDSLSRVFYSRHHFHYIYFKNDIEMELHWNICQKVNRDLLKELFQSKRAAKSEEAKIMVLGPEESILMLCMEFIKHIPQISPGARSFNRSTFRTWLYYSTLLTIYEIKKTIIYYNRKILWERFLSLVKLTEEKDKILTLLTIANRVIAAGIPEEIFENSGAPLKFFNYYLGIAEVFS